ncbi:MAG: carboxypeptidase-like regulatory domain-containing protein, partial [Planctomycetota bacterium]
MDVKHDLGLSLVLLSLLASAGCGGSDTQAPPTRALAPQEWIERVRAAQEAYAPREYDEADEILVTGRVRMQEDASLPADARLTLWSTGPIRRPTYRPALQDGRFAQRMAFGVVYAAAHAAGYAPAFAGPFEAEPGGEIADVNLVLGPGFEACLTLKGSEDEPIPNADVTAYYMLDEFHVLGAEFPADRDGVVRLEDLADRHLQLSITTDGYEYEQREHRFHPGETLTWRLRPAASTQGWVVCRATGEPIGGAEVCAIYGPLLPFVVPRWAPATAVSDECGRFSLASLRDDGTHDFFVRAPGYAPSFLNGVKAGQGGLKVELGPEIYVRGRILGPLEALQRHDGEPTVVYEQDWQRGRGRASSQHGASVEVRDGVGYFEINGLW